VISFIVGTVILSVSLTRFFHECKHPRRKTETKTEERQEWEEKKHRKWGGGGIRYEPTLTKYMENNSFPQLFNPSINNVHDSY
jgi:hypothetical protein